MKVYPEEMTCLGKFDCLCMVIPFDLFSLFGAVTSHVICWPISSQRRGEDPIFQ